MLERWHEFYILLGTAAAALVGLLFVAASIGAGYLSAEPSSPPRTFTSPIVFHYTYVLFFEPRVAHADQHGHVARGCHRTERGGRIGLFGFHPGPRPAQSHHRPRRSPRLWRRSGRRLRGGTCRRGAHLRALGRRAVAVGRRTYASAAGQHPQR